MDDSGALGFKVSMVWALAPGLRASHGPRAAQHLAAKVDWAQLLYKDYIRII